MLGDAANQTSAAVGLHLNRPAAGHVRRQASLLLLGRRIRPPTSTYAFIVILHESVGTAPIVSLPTRFLGGGSDKLLANDVRPDLEAPNLSVYR